MFFSMAPAILMTGFGFSPLGLSLFFASTVFVVFGAGILAPKLALRWGQIRTACVGILTALGGSVALLLGMEDPYYFSAAMTAFLLGMGLINPLGTAITLQPFGQKAGAASALLGFLQMGCAAIAIGVAALLSVPLYTAFCVVLVVNMGLSLLVFLMGCATEKSAI
jgi:DHA1 family bicyclomycin/chloramphenicol resistance-like MFS transporter